MIPRWRKAADIATTVAVPLIRSGEFVMSGVRLV
jgi:hypothetical protein